MGTPGDRCQSTSSRAWEQEGLPGGNKGPVVKAAGEVTRPGNHQVSAVSDSPTSQCPHQPEPWFSGLCSDGVKLGDPFKMLSGSDLPGSFPHCRSFHHS